MKVVVDTNIVFSAILNTNSRIASILLMPQSRVSFYTTDQLLAEINEHSGKIIKLSNFTENELQRLITLLIQKIKFINPLLISEQSFKIAESLTYNIDEDDIEFVALAHHLKAKLWSGDKKLLKGLEKKGWLQFITTTELWDLQTIG